MTGELRKISGLNVFAVDEASGPVRTDRDAMNLVALGLEQGAAWMTVPVDRLDPDFFKLSTRIAGEVIQKFVNYRIALAVVGDISAYVAASDALRDFVRESNRGRHVWFVADKAEFDARLAAIAA